MLSGCPRYFGSLFPSLSRASVFKRSFDFYPFQKNTNQLPLALAGGLKTSAKKALAKLTHLAKALESIYKTSS